MSWTPDATDFRAVNTLRALAIDAVEKANSGHPGLPLGAAPMAYVLWQRYLKHDPQAPGWADRDRFVLSAGHGSALLYALLHLAGYDVPIDELQRFRQWRSRTPGHPEFHVTPGVEATTGPLGQGSAVAVGMAIAERLLAARYNKPGHDVIDHFTYALVSDGDLMEGLSGEAASLAGHLQLGKLIYLYDANGITLDGPASLTFTEDVAARYRAYGWDVLEVENGDTDLAAIDAAIASARARLQRPTLIIVRTTIGYGCPAKQNSCAAHGAPLGAEQVRLTKLALDVAPDHPFEVPDEVLARFVQSAAGGARFRKHWLQRLANFEAQYPEAAAEMKTAIAGELPLGWDAGLPSFDPEGKGSATRESGGVVMNALAGAVPWLVGLDADLSSSTKTRIEGSADFGFATPTGRNIRAGVREHAMGAIANGIAYHGGNVPFTATFLAFSDYMRTPIRLAALDRLKVNFVFTHDSLAVGEDGPTHQPVEHVTSLRTIPGLSVLRPADGNEVAAAWRWWLGSAKGPAVTILTRQKLATLPGTREHAANGVAHGGYVLSDPAGQPELLLLASGSEVHLASAAAEALAQEGVRVRVVSMPCLELFAAQDPAYRDTILPPEVTARVAIEAGVSMPWYRWVGDRGRVIGVDRFGASAPGETVLAEYGFTVANVVSVAKSVL